MTNFLRLEYITFQNVFAKDYSLSYHLSIIRYFINISNILGEVSLLLIASEEIFWKNDIKIFE